MEGESVMRKLHNMVVQELKGNILVFCRVQLMLSTDLPPDDDFDEVRKMLRQTSPFQIRGIARRWR
jgi:hypothetical protein